MATARAEDGVGGVLEVHMTELMSIIGSASGGTVIGEGHTLPLGSVESGDVDRLGARCP